MSAVGLRMNGSEHYPNLQERVPDIQVQHARRNRAKRQRTGGQEKSIPEGTPFA